MAPNDASEALRGAITPSPSPAPSTSSSAAPAVKRFVKQMVPDSILHDPALNEAIAALPANYNFELHKTVWRIKQGQVTRVALQFPEGLLMFACIISDILERFAGVEHVYILGDVTYGACCVDDFSAAALGAQLLVHYGHSCLVPVDVTSIPCLYVFVDISIDVDHLVQTVELNFDAGCRLVLAGTIQFSTAIQLAKQRLAARYPALAVPKVRPLSPGEVLGCTAPVLNSADAEAIVFVADGRFHLESIMIANPTIPAYRYDPYPRTITQEHYDQQGMRAVRRRAIERAAGARRWGLVLGTLGRQGNPHILDMLQAQFSKRGLETTALLMSEISPPRLDMIQDVDAFVQVACPRLSIDWGEGFTRPTLTPFEALVALGEVPGWWEDEHSSTGRGRGGPEERGHGTAEVAASVEPLHSDKGEQGEGEVVFRRRAGASAAAAVGTVEAVGSVETVGAVAPYPMDYYAKEGGVWSSSWHKRPAAGATGGTAGGTASGTVGRTAGGTVGRTAGGMAGGGGTAGGAPGGTAGGTTGGMAQQAIGGRGA